MSVGVVPSDTFFCSPVQRHDVYLAAMSKPVRPGQDEPDTPPRRVWILLLALIVFFAVIAYRAGLRGFHRRIVVNNTRVMDSPAAKPAVQTAEPSPEKSVKVPEPMPPAPMPAPVPAMPLGPAEPAVQSPVVSAVQSNAPVRGTSTAGSNVVALADDFTKLSAEARALQEKAKLVEARSRYLVMLRAESSEATSNEAEAAIGAINMQLLLTPMPMPEKTYVVVQPGDSIDKYAKRFRTTVDLILESNQIKTPDLIKTGDRLNVFTGRVEIIVNKTRNDLLVRVNDAFFKRYRIGPGKYSRTPVGSFLIADRQREPVWWRPDGKEIPFGDKENILGTRWLSLKAAGDTPAVRGYGIHGTSDDVSIGKAESAGCVRLKNSDVEELFKYVPIGTPVTIIE